MTVNQLITAKEGNKKVVTSIGIGKVNGIGQKYTYIEFSTDLPNTLCRLIELPNSQIFHIV